MYCGFYIVRPIPQRPNYCFPWMRCVWSGSDNLMLNLPEMNEFRSGCKRTAGQQRQWCLELETEPWNVRKNPWTEETESIVGYGSVPVPGMYSVAVLACLLIVVRINVHKQNQVSRRRVRPIRELNCLLLALSGRIVRGSRLYCIVSPGYLHSMGVSECIHIYILWTHIRVNCKFQQN